MSLSLSLWILMGINPVEMKKPSAPQEALKINTAVLMVTSPHPITLVDVVPESQPQQLSPKLNSRLKKRPSGYGQWNSRKP
jgi:hypothetical protein